MVTNPYRSPQALRAALHKRANAAASAEGVDTNEILRRFYLARLLARVFVDDPHGWLLKGGQALLVRYPDARHSRDIDLFYRPDEGRLDDAVKALRRAAGLELGDFLRFEHYDTTRETQGRIARRVRFQPYLGGKPVVMVSVDLVADLAPLGEPGVRQLNPPIDLDLGADTWPNVLLYPLPDHVADKICALYEQYGCTGSTRLKDLVDLVVIALRDPLDGRVARDALQAEANRRRDAGTLQALPVRFTVPDRKVWESGYQREAAGVPGLGEYRRLSEAVELVDRFVTPLLAAESPGRWDPVESHWIPQLE